jgi:RNA polymerase-associated protein
MGVVAKHAAMILYSDGRDHYSQRVRMVLAEKGVAVEVLDVDIANKPEDLVDLNPYGSLPTLIDRDLVLYQSQVIMEYMEERFPHPPLLPVYPVARAQSRLLVFRIQKDWCGLVDTLMAGTSRESVLEKSRKELRERLITVAPIFDEKSFFMSDDFTLVDCCVAPILWRLEELGIDLPPKQTSGMQKYMQRIFDRETFQTSLSEAELDMQG